jgi:hypothetical protein
MRPLRQIGNGRDLDLVDPRHDQVQVLGTDMAEDQLQRIGFQTNAHLALVIERSAQSADIEIHTPCLVGHFSAPPCAEKYSMFLGGCQRRYCQARRRSVRHVLVAALYSAV